MTDYSAYYYQQAQGVYTDPLKMAIYGDPLNIGVISNVPPVTSGGDSVGDDGYRKYYTFLNSGTFNSGPATSADLLGVGAGGGAGDGVSGSFYDAGGAGGCVREIDDVAISGSIAVTVGVAPAYANGSNNGTDGPNGGDTIIGSLLTAPGGHGGGVDGAREGGDNADFTGSAYGGGANNNSGAGAGANGNGQQAAFNSTGGDGKITVMLGDKRGGGGAGGGNNGSANVGGDGGGGGYNVAGSDGYGGGGGHAKKGGNGLAIIAVVAPGAPSLASGPPTYIGAGTNVSSVGNLDKPAGIQNGDLLIVLVTGSNPAVQPTSGNFRLLYGRYGNASMIYYKIIDGSEPASWVPNSIGMTGGAAYRTYAFRGVNARHILDGIPVGGPQANPGMTTLRNNTLAVCINSMTAFSGGSIADVTNGFTADAFATNVGSVSHGIAHKLIATAGAVGSTNFPSTHGSSGTLMFGLRSN